MTRRLTRFALLAALTALAATLASPALAADTPAVARLHARADAEIARRLVALDRLAAVVSDARHLAGADRDALLNQISNDRSELTSLKATIDSDSNPTTLRAEVRRIVTDFRVYVLLEPQVRLVRALDAEQDAIARLTDVAAALKSRIDAAKSAGKDVTAAQTALDDMNAKLAAASAAVEGRAAAVIALTPSGYPGNRSTLDAVRRAVIDAHADLVAARDAARHALQALKS